MRMTATTWRSALLAACVCTVAAGSASADIYAYLQTNDDSFGVADLTTGGYTYCGNSGLLLAGLAEDPSGNVYGGAWTDSTFYQVNPADGSLTPLGTAGIDFYGVGSTHLGVYALDANFNFYAVNTATGATTEIGPTGLTRGSNDVYGVSSGMGQVYLDDDGTLYMLNGKTGKAKMRGSGPNPIGAMVYTHGLMYGATNATPPVVYTINLQTGAQTEVSTITNAPGIPYGLAPTPKRSKGTCP